MRDLCRVAGKRRRDGGGRSGLRRARDLTGTGAGTGATRSRRSTVAAARCSKRCTEIAAHSGYASPDNTTTLALYPVAIQYGYGALSMFIPGS